MSYQFMACDPGSSGAFAYTNAIGKIESSKMPDGIPGIVQLLREKRPSIGSVLFIEEVGGFTKAGGAQPGSSMFKFGTNFGAVIGAAVALGYEVRRVHPQKWIKAHSLGARGAMTKAAWKGKLKARAQEIFPQLKVTLETADALLILDAARRGLI